MVRKLIAVGILLCCITDKGIGATDAAKPPQPAGTGPEITLTLVDPNQKVYSWRNLRLQFAIVNGTLQSGIGVNSLVLSLPSSMAVTSDHLSRTSDGSLKLLESAFQMRAAGERRDFPPVELRGKYVSEMWGELKSILTYRGQKEAIVATLEYLPLGAQSAQTKTVRLDVPVLPNPIGIYIGALIGAFLAALLIPIHRFTMQAIAVDQSKPIDFPFPREFVCFIARYLRGVVGGAIAVLLLQTTSDFSFPISVGVQDFYGGVLLGILADQVSEQILKRITPSSEPVTAQKTKPNVPGVDDTPEAAEVAVG
jgi:hypothetical protein